MTGALVLDVEARLREMTPEQARGFMERLDALRSNPDPEIALMASVLTLDLAEGASDDEADG